MDKDWILVVEDDHRTSTYLKTYFDWLGYEVLVTHRGADALDRCRLKIPSVIILDVLLPDLNGYEVCRTLRSNNRTSQVPIIFLSQRSRRNDIIAAFELGADDYILKPFDIEELKLRVESVIRRSKNEAVIHPVTSLPAGELIIEKLKEIKDSAEPWTLLHINIGESGVLKEIETPGFINNSLIDLANILRQTVEMYGSPNDFIGQASDNSFIIVTIPETAATICNTVVKQFEENGSEHNGDSQEAGSPELAVGAVSSYDGPFTDIKQIAKTLAEFRYKRQKSGCPDEAFGLSLRANDIDYCNQLTEQSCLWQIRPDLAQALIEVEHLTAARIPDMNKVEVLFDLAADMELPAEILNQLQNQQQLCRLACENLRRLQYKIRSYQKVEPSNLLKTLEYIATLLRKPKITISATAETDSELMVALPELKLQQTIYNVCQWLLRSEGETKLDISLEITKKTAFLIFRPANFKENRLEIAALLEALNKNKTGAVYGYLAYKVVSRYGGQVTASNERVILNLPLGEPVQAGASTIETDALRQKTKEQRLFLDTQKRLTFPSHILGKATDLIDPLAEDLLAEIERMIATLSSTSGIDSQVYPWSGIERNYHFFRLLTLDLRKNRPLIPAPVNLESLLESIKPMLTHRIFNHQILIESEIAKPVINTDQMRLSQIFVNLGLNALEAMPEQGELKFKIKQIGKHYVIEVIDNGSGISPDNQNRVFDPHFTTKGSGHGAGLHNVKTYVKQLNGQIKVFSRPGQGARFIVQLPPSWETGYF